MGITPLVNTEKSNDTNPSDDFQELQPPLMHIRGGFYVINVSSIPVSSNSYWYRTSISPLTTY